MRQKVQKPFSFMKEEWKTKSKLKQREEKRTGGDEVWLTVSAHKANRRREKEMGIFHTRSKLGPSLHLLEDLVYLPDLPGLLDRPRSRILQGLTGMVIYLFCDSV